jgi:SAM-dependent methyltransferase
MSDAKLKSIIKDRYAAIVTKNVAEGSCCCGTECSTEGTYSSFCDDYTSLPGYNPDADLKLGCGIPSSCAEMNQGDTVLDLGSGAGNDVFVARSIVGEQGFVIGVDMTEEMIAKARKNADALGAENVEFRYGEIESLPVDDESIDVVISNCVLNLVPNKQIAFNEMYRVLRPGAHFSVSDIVLSRELPDGAKEAAELYAGCVSGALLKDDYLRGIEAAGFQNVEVRLEKQVAVPEDVLAQYLSRAELESYLAAGSAVLSITVYGEKPSRL